MSVGDDRVAASDVRPATRIDVQGEEPKDLVGGGLQVAVAGQADAREVLALGDLRLGP